jgi:hypothetical protein
MRMIREPVEILRRRVRDVVILYPAFIHQWGNNESMEKKYHTYRGSFSFHLACEKPLLKIKKRKIPLLSLVSELLLGILCAYPMRDVLLYVLWSKGYYHLRFQRISCNVVLFYRSILIFSWKNEMYVRANEFQDLRKLDPKSILFIEWFSKNGLLTDEAMLKELAEFDKLTQKQRIAQFSYTDADFIIRYYQQKKGC